MREELRSGFRQVYAEESGLYAHEVGPHTTALEEYVDTHFIPREDIEFEVKEDGRFKEWWDTYDVQRIGPNWSSVMLYIMRNYIFKKDIEREIEQQQEFYDDMKRRPPSDSAFHTAQGALYVLGRMKEKLCKE